VAGIASFKSYTGLWFYKGALMKDPASVLVNAQKGVTKALRQWRFEKNDPLDHDLLKSYIYEAIKIEDLKLDLPKQAIQKIQLPHVLQKSFIENKELEDSFLAFTPFKQKEFCEYIQSAKRESTKLKRLQKVIELMRKGEGLNDRYRK
jgi:uncharacterized protein YdeI (YjbR/CyaY-like superfamily)